MFLTMALSRISRGVSEFSSTVSSFLGYRQIGIKNKISSILITIKIGELLKQAFTKNCVFGTLYL